MNAHVAKEGTRRGLIARAIEIDRDMMRSTTRRVRSGVRRLWDQITGER